MTLVLIFYGFIAGGSVDFIFDQAFWIICIFVILFVALGIASTHYDKKRKKIRQELINDFESKETDFALSDKV